MKVVRVLVAFAVLHCHATAIAQLPMSGLPVPELQVLEDAIRSFMQVNDIGAGAVAIAHNGVPVYQRSFGWQDESRTVPLAPNAMMRLASVTKPLTAAAVRKLISDGTIGLHDRVFSLDQPGSGLLDHTPFGTPDPRLRDVTVDHLLRHRGGWDRDAPGVPDLTYQEINIAQAMGLESPPGRDATTRWIMGQELQVAPGTERNYSNIGYLLLGQIVEHVTGRKHIDYLREEVFSERINFPAPQLIHGRTFAEDHDPREPHYDSSSIRQSVFDPTETVPSPYGSWDHEARIGQGGIVADAMTILDYLGRHQVNGDGIGGPRPSPGSWRWNHTGSLQGTNTLARQRGDGIDYVVLFNKRSSGTSFGTQIRTEFDRIIDSGAITSWPTNPITSFEVSMPGDYNLDGVVDAADYTVWRDSQGQSVRAGTSADGSGDGIIDEEDYVVWSENFGLVLPRGTSASTAGPAYPIPEPGSRFLLLLGLTARVATARQSAPHVLCNQKSTNL